jgi:hypothetical protein
MLPNLCLDDGHPPTEMVHQSLGFASRITESDVTAGAFRSDHRAIIEAFIELI